MAEFIGVLVGGLLILISMPALIFSIQIVLAMSCKRVPPAPCGNRRPRIGVLIPAHNEAAVIGETLATLLPQLQQHDVLWVVADNCTDNTAEIARLAGCRVYERKHATRRGKGYALDFGIKTMAADPPEVVIIVDADCQVLPGALDEIATAADCTGRPVQARYLMKAPLGASVLQRIAEFAWLIRNDIRPWGFASIGMPCQLMGSGMGFTWKLIADARLASGNIVEDMVLGIDLACAGSPPLYCRAATVCSKFPSRPEVIRQQRQRWEHGHLSTLGTRLFQLLGTGLRRKDLRIVAMALDLCVPPVALLLLMACLTAAISLMSYFVFGTIGYLLWSVAILMSLGGAIAMSWWRFGRTMLGFADLLIGMWYVMRKIPLYVGFVLFRQVEWVKSRRDVE